MAEEATENAAPEAAPETFGAAIARWWQTPAMVIAAVLLLGAIAVAIASKPNPDYGVPIREAEAQLDRDEPEAAIETLNSKVYPNLVAGNLSPDESRAYRVLLGRALYLGQIGRRVDLRENNLSIMTEYHEAERLFAELEPRDIFFLADTYIRLRRFDDAFARAESLPPEEDERRYRLLRRIIEAHTDLRDPDLPEAARLLADFAARVDLPDSERLWVLARQTEVRMRSGYPAEALDRLLQEMPRLRNAGAEGLGELHLLLAACYQQIEPPRHDESEKNLARAETLLDGVSGELVGRLNLLWARALLASPDRDATSFEAVRDRLATVLERFRSTDSYLPALMLSATVEAQLGNFSESFEEFDRLGNELELGRTAEGVNVQALTDELLELHDRQRAAGLEQEALRFAKLAEGAHPLGETPGPVLLALAESNRAIADALMPEDERSRFGGDTLARLDPATRRLVAGHLRAAGAYYRGHADSVALSDNEAFGASLWLAADSFDRAGERQSAIGSFGMYVESFPAGERQAEARFRLGQAFQARAEFGRASEVYRALIEDRADQFGPRGVGPFADASYVPLAQTYLLDEDPENDAEAEALLRQVVDGVVAAVAPEHHRDALVELGRLRYLRGEHARAIERLEGAVDRYPDDPRLNDVRFLLADAYRKAAEDLRTRLENEPMPDSQRVAMQNERRVRLERSADLFAVVRDGLESVPPLRRTSNQLQDLRHSYYYLGDCHFDLGEYTEAIRYYNEAREQYPTSPSSLVAMVQIVNAYVELGDLDRARTADERARRFYESLPPSAFDDPTLPMGRRDWERWLDSSGRLYALQGGG
ncbi:MAG: tetratricopeptide repeat protein [Planctomycetota bacterium]